MKILTNCARSPQIRLTAPSSSDCWEQFTAETSGDERNGDVTTATWQSVAKESRFQSFTSDNEVRSLDVRIKYPPVFIAERIIRKHIQSIVIIKQYPDLPASPTSIRRTKNCRVSPWNSTAIRLSRLLEPSGSQLKSSGRSLVSSGG